MQRSIKRLDKAHQQLIATVLPLSPAVFSRTPSENEWSVAEILQHLCLVEERVIKELERGLEKPAQKLGLLRRLMPTAIVASRMIKVKAPKAMIPAESLGKDESLATYDATRTKLKQLCDIHGAARLRQVIFKHPFLGMISGVATISFVGYHERRHLKQIHEVLHRLGS